jgi:MoaA/NifB/PqqE/SkfB family radical SAM enzyme
MTLSNFTRVLDKFKHAITLEFTGGEPFLNTDIINMIKLANSRKIYSYASTSGAMDKKILMEILNSHLPKLSISLNESNPNEYASTQQVSKDMFYKVINNITYLLQQRHKHNKHLRLHITSVCTKRNYKKIPDMVHLADDLRVDELFFRNLIPTGLTNCTKDQSLYEEDHDVIETIESVETPRSQLKVIMPCLYRKTVKDRLCKDPFTTITIDGEGRVMGVCQIIKNMNTNIFFNENVWNNFIFQNMRETFLHNNNPLPEECMTCYNMFQPYKIIN